MCPSRELEDYHCYQTGAVSERAWEGVGARVRSLQDWFRGA